MTYDVENINSINKGSDLLLTNKPRIVPRGIEKYRKGTRSAGELHYKDYHNLNENKTKRKNLAMAWIDIKKGYDFVQQRWIINCPEMYKISDEIKLYWEIHENMKMELTAGGKSLGEAKIKRGTFQGDALSPLLFRIAMMPLNHLLRKSTAGYKLSKSQEKINQY